MASVHQIQKAGRLRTEDAGAKAHRYVVAVHFVYLLLADDMLSQKCDQVDQSFPIEGRQFLQKFYYEGYLVLRLYAILNRLHELVVEAVRHNWVRKLCEELLHHAGQRSSSVLFNFVQWLNCVHYGKLFYDFFFLINRPRQPKDASQFQKFGI